MNEAARLVGAQAAFIRLVAKNSNTKQVDCPGSMGSIHTDVTKVRQGQESCNLSTDL